LQKDRHREGDQRPAVTLRQTPSLAVSKGPSSRDPSAGQGPGDEGEGYHGNWLAAGQGGEETLKQWLGWKRGEDFDVENGGLVKLPKPKL